MATVISVSLDQFPARLEQDLRDLERKLILAMRRSATRSFGAIMVSIASTRPHPPADTGRYKASWAVERTPDGAILYNPLLYAILIELGRRPGRWPPRDVIMAWVKRKLRPKTWGELMNLTFLVRRKIGMKGIEPRHVLRRALPAMQRTALDEIRKALAP